MPSNQIKLLDIPVVRELFLTLWSDPDRATISEIAKRFDVNRLTIHRWAQDLGVEKRRLRREHLREVMGKLMEGALMHEQLLDDPGLDEMAKHWLRHGLGDSVTRIELLVPVKHVELVRRLQSKLAEVLLEEVANVNEETATVEQAEPAGGGGSDRHGLPPADGPVGDGGTAAVSGDGGAGDAPVVGVGEGTWQEIPVEDALAIMNRGGDE